MGRNGWVQSRLYREFKKRGFGFGEFKNMVQSIDEWNSDVMS